MIPVEPLTQDNNRKYGKHAEGNDFLKNFQLSGAEMAIAYTVGRDLKKILEKGNAPANQNDKKERITPLWKIFQMAVPSYRHKRIGDDEKQECDHQQILQRLTSGATVLSRVLKSLF